MLIGLVVLLGVGLVFAARTSREPVVAPRTGDHWHSAYEIYDCGTALPAIQNQTDPDGIHTHGDGLLHIHPFNSSATGTDARLSVFFAASGLNVTEESITSGEFDPIEATAGCGDEDSAIKVARWKVDGADGVELVTVYTEDFGNIRFLEEREAFTIARVPADEDPPPPSAEVLAALDSSTGTTNLASDPSTTAPDVSLAPGVSVAPDDTVPEAETTPTTAGG